jgi:type II secretory pathway pseudopilin PulG
MVVIAIIGVLATALFPALTWYLSRARDAKKIAEIKALNTALILYRADKWTYIVPGTGAGAWQWWVNFVWMYGATTYTKSIFTGLQELWYIAQSLTQKTIADYTKDPVPTIATPWNPCINTVASVPLISWGLYMLYFNDLTWQYSISGYLENPKQADIGNIQQAFSPWVNEICARYGRNYAVGNN